MTKYDLLVRQSLPLSAKIILTEQRLRAFFARYQNQVYVSFSGGKDSTVLLHIARRLMPSIPAVFVDTGLEWPEVVAFTKTIPDLTVLRPKKPFTKVLQEHGYPVVSKEVSQKIYEIRNTKSDKLRDKRLNGDSAGNGKLSECWKPLIDAPFPISAYCCNVMKKGPVKEYEKETGRKPIVATMASDSTLRLISYLKNGCNSFSEKRPMSTPMGFWLEEDIWAYLREKNVPYSAIYDKGYTRTGCMFCMFGVHREREEQNRFERMAVTHPALHKYCMEKLGLAEVLQYLGLPSGK